jgi:hypothetical protein
VVVRYFLAGLFLAACSEDPELFVELRTDFVPEAEFVRVRTRIETQDGLVLERESFGGFNDDFIRGQRVAEFGDLSLGMHLVQVELFSPWGASLSSRRIALDFRASRGITVVMTRTCAFTSCPGPGDSDEATECYGGRCVTPACSPENPDACGAPACETDAECGSTAYCARALCDNGVCLVATVVGACRATEWCDPVAGCVQRRMLPDAAMPDGGSGCTGDGACDDGFECTIDRCEDGTCRHEPDDSACTASEGGSCVEGFGCQYPGCTPASCVPETGCQRARCEGAECVLEDACAPGMCCGDACVPAGCDDGNACTDDSCGPSGCVNAPNTGPCSDGVFCNGPDTCASGACSMHAGPPCPGMSTCDEEGDTCAGCSDDASCPADEVGPYSACSFADICSESGSQTRIRTTYECRAGTCVSSDRVETGSCSRDTDGTGCGGTTFSGWSACSFSDECDESGTQTRTRTDPVCMGGTCLPVASDESQACARSTGGAACGSPSYTAWSACTGFSTPCDESGTQSRTRTDYTCGSGTCNPTSMTPETMPCMRDSDGNFCEGPCGCTAGRRCCEPPWGTCAGGTCDTTGGGICVCSTCACP